MSSIDHFRTELRIKIGTLESEFNFLAERMTSGDLGSEEVARTYLERLTRRIARKLPIRKSAETTLNQRRVCLSRAHTVDGGESQRIVGTRNRALAAMDIASAALDEAAHSAVEAWLAEQGATECAPPETLARREGNHESSGEEEVPTPAASGLL